MIITATIPDDIAPLAGEEFQLQGRVLSDGTFLVTKIFHPEPSTTQDSKAMTLTGWASKWAGTMKLDPGETRETLRGDYLKGKFGS